MLEAIAPVTTIATLRCHVHLMKLNKTYDLSFWLLYKLKLSILFHQTLNVQLKKQNKNLMYSIPTQMSFNVT